MLQGLTTASFSSLAWFDKAGGGAFKDANSRLRTAVKDTLVPALAACLQSAASTTAGVALNLFQAQCYTLPVRTSSGDALTTDVV